MRDETDTGAWVPVLDVDPDLGASIESDEWRHAREACRGRLIRPAEGVWAPPAGAEEIVGWLIVGGRMCREVALCDRHMVELLARGDVLLRPAADDGPSLGDGVVLTAGAGTALVELGAPFLRACARWPCLWATLTRRLEVQREHLALQGLIAHLPRAEHRVLLTLAHLADRWGRVTPAGKVLPLPLTHGLLAHLAAARRSTVSLAVAALELEGCIRRLDDRSWLLTPAGEKKIAAIVATGSRRVLGDTFLLRRRAG